MKVVGISIAVLAVVLLGACSTAPYQKATAELAEGFGAANSAFKALSEEERKAVVSSQVHIGLLAGNYILPANCRRTASTIKVGTATDIDCRPLIYDASTKTRTRVEVDPAAPKLLEYGRVLEAYGKGLADLAAAKDIAELKEASGKVFGAATSVATTFGGPVVGAAVGATLGVIDWLVGAYLDNRRFQELKHIVKETDPSIELGMEKVIEAAILMQHSVVLKRAADLTYETNLINAQRRAGANPAQIQAAGEDFVNHSLALQAYARTDVREPFVKMREAHAELLKSLENPKLDPAAAYKAIDAFRTKAIAMKEAFSKLGAKP